MEEKLKKNDETVLEDQGEPVELCDVETIESVEMDANDNSSVEESPIESNDTDTCSNDETKEIEKPKIPIYKRKSFFIIITVLFVVILGAILALVYLSPGNVAKRFAKLEIQFDGAKLHNYWAYDDKTVPARYSGDEEKFFEDMSDYLEEDIASWKDYYRYEHDKKMDELEEKYYSYTISTEVQSVKEISLKKLEYDISLSEVERDHGFDKETISAFKEVKVKLKIKGEDRTDRVIYTIYMGKQNGLWKVIEYNKKID